MNMVAGIFFLLVMLLVLIGVPSVAGLTVWLLARRSGTGEQSCGKCGYSVRHLTTFNCPECGADLREVGIRRQSGKGPVMIAAATGVFVMVVLLCGGFWMLVSVRVSSSVSPVFSQPAQLAPVPGSPSSPTPPPTAPPTP